MINEILKQREIDLQEAQLNAQKGAMEANQRDWWQPILGQAVGTGLGMWGGGWLSNKLGIKNPYATQSPQGATQPFFPIANRSGDKYFSGYNIP